MGHGACTWNPDSGGRGYITKLRPVRASLDPISKANVKSGTEGQDP